MTQNVKFGRMQIDGEKPDNPAPGVWMIPGFANTGVIETDEGLVLVDMPVQAYLEKTMTMLRQISLAAVHTVFVTHGHLDHAFHVDPLFDEAERNGNPPPRVIAHRNVLKRFQKYRMLAEYHEHINRIQFNFATGEKAFPLPKRNPDEVFDKSISIRVGGIDFHAFHGLGETDDHLWVWVPEKKTIFAGDFVIYSFPNVGNPFKVQRYTLEWAEALETMVGKEPDILIPGHGPVVAGKDAIRELLLKISSALRYLHQEVIKRLNQGMLYEDILHDVHLPPEMLDDDFLAPRYGCPTFVVHGILRQHAGWYDGNPSNLFPPKRSDLYSEIQLLLGKNSLIEHARRLKQEGQESMALQFMDMALTADLEDSEKREIHRLKGELLDRLGQKDPSFIVKSIYFRAGKKEKELAADL